MDKNRILVFSVCAFVLFTILVTTQNFSLNAQLSDPSVKTYGTIMGGWCKVFGGTVVNYPIDSLHTQTADFCKVDERYFRIVEKLNVFCPEVVAVWRDPATGMKYQLGSPCDVPRLCNPTDGSFGRMDEERSYLTVTEGEKKYDVSVVSTSVICDFKFLKDEKKISVNAQALMGKKSSVELIIPTDLLGGEYKVLINNNTTEFDIERDNSVSKIIIPVDFSKESNDIDVIGTEVIPEFPQVGVILPPRKQMLNVEPKYIHCNNSLVFVYKSTDSSPVCVKAITAYKLNIRGWIKPSTVVFETDRNEYRIGENITITMKNSGIIAFETPTIPIGFAIKAVINNMQVYSFKGIRDGTGHFSPGDQITNTWNQKDQNGNQVKAGTYLIVADHFHPKLESTATKLIKIVNK